MKQDVISDYLALPDAQREAIFAELATVDPARLWQRPGPKAWSVGAHHDEHHFATIRRILE